MNLYPLIDERFTDLTLVGEGVSAKVYKARDRQLDSIVALKLLNPHLHTDPVSLERFHREIQITRHINHAGVVKMYDILNPKAQGQIGLVMEYIDGVTLKERIQQSAPMNVDCAFSVLRQILEILVHCHRKDVIHRDLKPQNIMLQREDDRVRLLDFGIARMTALSDLTQTGTSLGSPEYMAPELFAGTSYDPRTDIYALGVIAYEMLSGRLPFQGDTLPILFRQHLESKIPPLKIGPDIWIEPMVQKMLAKLPHHRYQSAEEVLLDLSRKEVTLESFHRGEKRICLKCAKDTLKEVQICTYCGFDFLKSLDDGEYEMVASEHSSPEQISSFLKEVWGEDFSERRRQNRFIVDGADADHAELLKKVALRHRVILSARPKKIARRDRGIIVNSLILTGSLVLFLCQKAAEDGIFTLLAEKNFTVCGYGPFFFFDSRDGFFVCERLSSLPAGSN